MSYLDNLEHYVGKKEETDYIMPIWLPFIPFLIIPVITIAISAGLFIYAGYLEYIGDGVAGFGPPVFLFVLMALLILVGVLVHVYVLYKWLDRRNSHFNRSSALYEEFAYFLEDIANRKGVDIQDKISTITRDLREARYEESERSAVLYVILYIIFNPIIIYIFHFLNEDFVKHSRREVEILDSFNKILDSLDVDKELSGFKRGYTFPERNTVVYFVLSLITFGIFGLYWIYTITVDPNNHFNEHRSMESEILDVARQIEDESPSQRS